MNMIMNQRRIIQLVCLVLTMFSTYILYTVYNSREESIFVQLRNYKQQEVTRKSNKDVEKLMKASLTKLETLSEKIRAKHRNAVVNNIDKPVRDSTDTTLESIEKFNDVLSQLNESIDKDEAEGDLEWLDREDGKKYADYGDGTCPNNTNKKQWQMMLRKWHALAEKHNIRYFLTAGSLLGAWRNEDAIPYDQDVDIRMHIDDFEKIYPLRQRKFIWNAYDDHECHFYFTRDWRLPYDKRRRFNCDGKRVPEYEGQCSFTDPNARMIYRQWHIDIYAYTTYLDIVKCIPKDLDFEYKKSDILPLTRCMFLEVETRCPQNPRVIFEKLYSSIKPHRTCKNHTWIKD